MRILVVEDDESVAEPLAQVLRDRQHYTVDIANDGQTAWDFLEAYSYDLLLLDVMLPKLDGVSICRRLRQRGNQMPVLMLTARDTSNDKVIGLDVGADDYVVKPFNLPELLARIRALLRRGNAALPPILEWQGIQLDPSSCQVTYQGQLLHLTPKEYGLLELFLRNSTQILSRATIIDHLWSFDSLPTDDTVKVHIKDLRKKLRAAGAPTDIIEAVYGMGYRLKQKP